ncbi:Sec-dependent nitrous-oxide reductase [Winogradskyella alexanderae]|uniref:Sec-dependent nitrous-oxide reductase n=1 Tax=Winogradskyella alexanderae TaxID=2877123 RepID=A0ABS7XU30_9FLAO|nr:Sec-dependent nitrous-oxide reductase [Winogradskyella alexanderae]MCA0132938.1 Sec-dependent nitrous-oxide reductase [Winogradskyella alexanderae]
MNTIGKYLLSITALIFITSCGNNNNSNNSGAMSSSKAEKVYVAPGEHDEYYAFMSGGYSGNLTVYGLPSGRMLKEIPVFSQFPTSGYGYSEETKPMLNTSFGFVPWGDSHHPDISQTNGELDGRWIFINENNTPRIARISLETFETEEIIELPNSAGNHASSFVTENTEYIVAGTRFAVPNPQRDMPINEMKGQFKGPLSFVSIADNGRLNLEFQLNMPGFNYDLAHPGRNKSHGWFFFTSYNTEEANTLMEVNASQNDKDYIAAVNWQKIAEYVKNGGGEKVAGTYAHNVYDEKTHTATSTMKEGVISVNPKDVEGAVFYIPIPKSPHGCDVDPSGEYIIGSGKLSTDLSVYSFEKMLTAIANKDFVDDSYGIPVLSYENTIAGVVKQPGLGPLHTEFDGQGNAYTTFFISSEVVKWKLGTWEILDRQPTFYSVGHLMIPGGNSRKPFGKYMVALNKITKDRYLPTGPELEHSAQLYDISGDKMELLSDFPTHGEPHYAAGIRADIIKDKSKKYYELSENEHPYVAKSESESTVTRNGNEVHISMTMIRSHFSPDNIEGVKVGDKVYLHLTNLEQDFDVPHGFSIIGANTSEILVMPGQTKTIVWEPKREGVWPFYCTDFCSALHQEMQGYIRVSAANANTPLKFTLDE